MLKLNVNGNEVLMYDSIMETPIHRHMDFNRYVMIDSGLGGDIESIDGHIGSVNKYIALEDYDNAKKQLMNLRTSMYMCVQKVNPKLNSFVALTKSINSREIENVGDDYCPAIIDELGKKGLTYGKLINALGKVKKKLTLNLKRFFQSSLIQRKLRNTSTD